MTSDVVLTAALRNNLLSLQNTQSAIDKTQFRLASGRKVNSALDNPQNFFAAQALNNRASDLTRLLDSIGQSIQTIQAADNGVTALTSLVEQADSLANSARDALASGQSEAKIAGDRDLSGIADITSLTGIVAGDTITFSVTDEDGDAVDIGFYNTAGGANATQAVTFAANQSIDEVVALINDIRTEAVEGSGNSDGDQVFEATLDAGGNLQIRTLNGGDFRVVFTGNAGAGGDSQDLALAADLGFGDVARLHADGGGAANSNAVSVTALADVAIRSLALYDPNAGDPEIAERSDLLLDPVTGSLEDVDGNGLFANINAATDDYVIGINGGTTESIELFSGNGTASVSIQDFIDSINANTNLNQFIEASFDDATGEITIRAISADVESIEVGVSNSVQTANFGFGLTDNPDDATGFTGNANAGGGEIETIRLASAAAELAQYEIDYNRVRDQITELVTNGDTGYRGTNLLNGNDLLTVFNEDRTSSLTTNGVTFTADGLGITEADFSRISTTEGALAEIRSALETVRNFGSTLASDLSTIQTRETFTQNTINTLTAGADKLTIADQNEEGAKLLALQTRQQLGVTSLALASQSQQSILRLF